MSKANVSVTMVSVVRSEVDIFTGYGETIGQYIGGHLDNVLEHYSKTGYTPTKIEIDLPDQMQPDLIPTRGK